MNFSFLPLSVKKYMRAFVLSFALTTIILSILSVIFTFFPPAEKLFCAIENSSVYFASFLAAFFSGRFSEKNGALTGITAGLSFFLILLCIGIFFFGLHFTASAFLKSASAALLCGICGGILGINFK